EPFAVDTEAPFTATVSTVGLEPGRHSVTVAVHDAEGRRPHVKTVWFTVERADAPTEPSDPSGPEVPSGPEEPTDPGPGDPQEPTDPPEPPAPPQPPAPRHHAPAHTPGDRRERDA